MIGQDECCCVRPWQSQTLKVEICVRAATLAQGPCAMNLPRIPGSVPVLVVEKFKNALEQNASGPVLNEHKALLDLEASV